MVIFETKKKDTRIKQLEGEHLLLWSGVKKEEKAEAGTEWLLHEEVTHLLNDWEAISKRILMVELIHRTHLKTIIAVYGPSENE